jgi:oligopeptide/dipeptide ABC transporter ATP-binding protein
VRRSNQHGQKEPILRIKDLDVHYYTDAGVVKAANEVNFELTPGERLGLVGESGSGKSTLALAILRMIKKPGSIAGGEIWLEDVDLAKLSEEQMRKVRGSQISMVPQGAMNSLNPVMRIKDQLMDTMIDHDLGLSKAQMAEMAVDALRAVELDPQVGNMFPHELSGGMKQRACIAISVAMNPKVIIADEPTSALDVITQRQVMETLGNLQERLGSAIILIGHDMGLMAQFADRIGVLYAGKLVEQGPVRQIFRKPEHPYTRLLMESLPSLEEKEALVGGFGSPPSAAQRPRGCVFHPRCPYVMDRCIDIEPIYKQVAPNQWAACHLHDEADSSGVDSPLTPLKGARS